MCKKFGSNNFSSGNKNLFPVVRVLITSPNPPFIWLIMYINAIIPITTISILTFIPVKLESTTDGRYIIIDIRPI